MQDNNKIIPGALYRVLYNKETHHAGYDCCFLIESPTCSVIDLHENDVLMLLSYGPKKRNIELQHLDVFLEEIVFLYKNLIITDNFTKQNLPQVLAQFELI